MGKRFYSFFYILICALSLFASPPALAQNATSFENVPQAYIDEASDYAAYCSGNHFMRQYYNCDCLGVKFLDKRIERGELATKEQIAASLSKECRDATEASGVAYENCIKTASTMKPGTDPEKLCECVGNTYSKLIERDKPTINSNVIVTFSARARILCEDPNAAANLGLRPVK